MFEDNVLESRPHTLDEIESPQFVPAVGRVPNAKSLNQGGKVRAPVRGEDPGEWTDRPAQPEKKPPQATSKKPRMALLKRRPVVFAIGAMLLGAAVGGGYVYLDDAEHFQSTDDAFIAEH
jgi:membrane fusion protein (multidrug efflux system)